MARAAASIKARTVADRAELAQALGQYTQAYITHNPKAPIATAFHEFLRTSFWGTSEADKAKFPDESRAVDEKLGFIQELNALRVELAAGQNPAQYTFEQAYKANPDFKALYDLAVHEIEATRTLALDIPVTYVGTDHKVETKTIKYLTHFSGSNNTLILTPPSSPEDKLDIAYWKDALVLEQVRFQDLNRGATGGGLLNSFTVKDQATLETLVNSFASQDFQEVLDKMNFEKGKDLMRHDAEVKALKAFIGQAVRDPKIAIPDPVVDGLLKICQHLKEGGISLVNNQQKVAELLNFIVDGFKFIGQDGLPIHKDGKLLGADALYDGNLEINPEYRDLVSSAHLGRLEDVNEKELQTALNISKKDAASQFNAAREFHEENNLDLADATVIQIIKDLSKPEHSDAQVTKFNANGVTQNGTDSVDTIVAVSSGMKGASRSDPLLPGFPPSITHNQTCYATVITPKDPESYASYVKKFNFLNEERENLAKAGGEVKGYRVESTVDSAVLGGCVLNVKGEPEVADLNYKNIAGPEYTYSHEARVALKIITAGTLEAALAVGQSLDEAQQAVVRMMTNISREALAHNGNTPRIFDFEVMASKSYSAEGMDFRAKTFQALAEELFDAPGIREKLGEGYSEWCVDTLRAMQRAAQDVYFASDDGSLRAAYDQYKAALAEAEDAVHSVELEEGAQAALMEDHIKALTPAEKVAIFKDPKALVYLVKHCTEHDTMGTFIGSVTPAQSVELLKVEMFLAGAHAATDDSAEHS